MGNLEALVNNLKRTSLVTSLSLATLIGIPNKTETPIFAQETKKELNVAAENKEELYKWIVDEHTKFFNQYADAKDKEKAQSQYEIIKSFDTKKAEDLVKTIEKIQGKTNTKKVEKINKEYETFKTNEIEKIYNTGAEKLKTDKNQAEEIFFNILKIDKNSTKFDEALEKELNWKKINGYLLPPEIAGAREKGMKYLNDASEGEADKTEDDLVATLKLENDKIFRRKSKDIIVRSTLNEESAKRAHKVSEASMRLLLDYLGLAGKQPYNIRDEKSTDSYPAHRITILTNDEQLKKFKDSTTWFGLEGNANVHEQWKSKDSSKYGYGHFHRFTNDDKKIIDWYNDQISHYTIEDVITRSSHYVANSDIEGDSPWLFRSFIYNFTWQVLGTTSTSKFLDREDKYEGKIQKVTKIKTADQMRAGAYFLATDNKLIPVDLLKSTKFDQFSDRAMATAFAATEYLIQERKDQIINLFADAYNKKSAITDSLYNIEKITGLTSEQFDKNVQEFVLKKYIGHRNYKE